MFIIIIIIFFFIIIIIIIIIKKCWKCKAGREPLTPYQSDDPSHTTPTHRMKEISRSQKGMVQQLGLKKALALLLKPASPTPQIQVYQDRFT